MTHTKYDVACLLKELTEKCDNTMKIKEFTVFSYYEFCNLKFEICF